MAAPAYRSHTVVTNGNSTSCALSLPAGFAANDILIAVVFKENSNAFTATPSGFALVTGGRDTNSFYSVDVYWKRATGSESGSQTFTWSGSVPRSAYLVAISGAITSGDPWDPSTLASWTYSSSGAMAAGSVTTTVAETLILGIYTVDNGGATWTSGSSMTERIDNGDTYLQTVEQASAGATGTKSATPSVNNERKGWLLPLKPAAGGTDVTVTPGLTTSTLTLHAPTVSATRNVTVSPSLLTMTSSLLTPTVSATRNVTVQPDLITATASVLAPTVSTTQNATVEPAQQTATLSVLTPTVSAAQNVTVTPSLLTLTGSVHAPTVSTTENVTVTPDLITVTLSLHAPSVSVGGSVTVTPDLLTVTSSVLAPTVSAAQNVTVTPDLLTLTSSVLAASISTTRSVTATPDQIVGTITLLTPTVSANGNVTATRATASDSAYTSATASDALYVAADASTAVALGATASDSEG